MHETHVCLIHTVHTTWNFTCGCRSFKVPSSLPVASAGIDVSHWAGPSVVQQSIHSSCAHPLCAVHVATGSCDGIICQGVCHLLIYVGSGARPAVKHASSTGGGVQVSRYKQTVHHGVPNFIPPCPSFSRYFPPGGSGGNSPQTYILACHHHHLHDEQPTTSIPMVGGCVCLWHVQAACR